MYSIDHFKNQVSKQGLMRGNRFTVVIFPPRGMTSSGGAVSTALSQGGILDVALPGLNAVDNIVDKVNNLSLPIPNGSVSLNSNIPTLGFALTGMGDKVEALETYATAVTIPGRSLGAIERMEFGDNRTLGFKHEHGEFTVTYLLSEDARERYFFELWQNLVYNPQFEQYGYYEDYIGRVEIKNFSASHLKTQSNYQMEEVYPSSIGDISLEMGDGTHKTIDITFKYRRYKKIA